MGKSVSKKKNYLRRIIALTAVVLLPLCVSARSVADSLYHALKLLDKQEKMDGYNNFLVRNSPTLSIEDLLKICDYYQKDAERLKSQKDIEYVRVARVLYLYNFRMFDEFNKILPDELAYLKSKKSPRYYTVFSTQFDYLILTGKYQTALRIVEQFYQEENAEKNDFGLGLADYYVALAYSAIGREHADTYYKKAVYFFEQEPLKYYNYLSDCYDRYTEYLIGKEMFSEARPVCQKWGVFLKQYLKNMKKENAMESIYYQFYYYRAAAQLYIGLHKSDSANYYIRLADSIREDSFYMKMNVMKLKSNYYELIGNNSTALKCMDTVLAFQKQIDNDNIQFILTKRDIARLLFKTGNYKDAYLFYDEYYTGVDSLQTKEFARQLDEINSLNQVDKLEAEKHTLRLWLIFIATLTAILSLFLIIYFLLKKRLRHKDKVICENIVESVAKEKKNTKNEENLILPEASLSEKELFYEQLFEKIKEVLCSEQLYVNPDFSREELSALVFSNKTYISDAIKMMTGKTFLEYLNQLRLKYACKMMMEHPEMDLGSVAVESGFKSRSNFFAQFKTAYDITPGEFRHRQTK